MYIKHLNSPTSIFLRDIPDLWAQNDILILLIDLDSYTFGTRYLDDHEKEDLNKLKTSYFKARYIVSRTILKFILHYLLEDQSVFKIGTYKDENGRVHIRDHEKFNICISYSGNMVSLAISKVNLGIDIELKKQFLTGKFTKNLNKQTLETEDLGSDFAPLTLLTLKEAYSKFSNKSILSCLNKKIDLSNIFSSSYILDDRYILSIITDAEPNAINISYLQNIESYEYEVM